MATVDLRTLPISEQHHTLAFNELGRTGRRASDFLWICPECDDGVTYPPVSWSGGEGFVHYRDTGDWDTAAHRLVAVDVIAVIEMWRGLGFGIAGGADPKCFNISGALEFGTPRGAAHAS